MKGEDEKYTGDEEKEREESGESEERGSNRLCVFATNPCGVAIATDNGAKCRPSCSIETKHNESNRCVAMQPVLPISQGQKKSYSNNL